MARQGEMKTSRVTVWVEGSLVGMELARKAGPQARVVWDLLGLAGKIFRAGVGPYMSRE